MFARLFARECRQTAKSLIYYFYIGFVAVFFLSQMGSVTIHEKPREGQSSYGTKPSDDPGVTMSKTLGKLAGDYYHEHFVTYPIGFAKTVTLSAAERSEIDGILEELTGMDEQARVSCMEQELKDGMDPMPDGSYVSRQTVDIKPADGITYEIFVKKMQRVDDLLGGGSSYAEEKLSSNASVDMTYEDALEQYQDLIEKDKFTGGYARLFCDYMAIVLGIAPVFMAVTRSLRDKRASMQEVIFVRSSSSAVIVTARYAAMAVMMAIPVFLLSLMPLIQCLLYTSGAGIAADGLAFVKYTIFLLVPEILAVSALGMMLTELTGTAIAIVVQLIWWFISIFGGAGSIHGGNYGWNLIPRNNSVLNYSVYIQDFRQLLANRLLYVGLAVGFLALTVFIYGAKRKGRLNFHGTLRANRKV